VAGVGRPSKFTPAVVDKLTTAIRQGATYDLASKFAGIDYETFRDWRKQGDEGVAKYSAFSVAVKQAEGDATMKWLSHVEDAAEGGTWQAAAWKLERRYPESYSVKNRHEISGPDGGAVAIQTQHEHVHKLSQEQAASVVEILAEAGALDANNKLPPP